MGVPTLHGGVLLHPFQVHLDNQHLGLEPAQRFGAGGLLLQGTTRPAMTCILGYCASLVLSLLSSCQTRRLLTAPSTVV